MSPREEHTGQLRRVERMRQGQQPPRTYPRRGPAERWRAPVGPAARCLLAVAGRPDHSRRTFPEHSL